MREPATSWRISRFPPISRGGIVRRPSRRGCRDRGLREGVGHRRACGRECLLAARDLVHQLVRGCDADDARERLAGNRNARELRRARLATGDVPLDEVRIGEHVGEEAEAGKHGGDAEVARLVREELDVDSVARLGIFDVDGARQRMAQPEVDVEHVRVRAVAGELAVDPVARLERDLVARPQGGHRLQVGMPAVVRACRGNPHRSSATSCAAFEAAAISSAVQRRGRSSWCNETTARSRPSSKIGVTIWAARPPYVSSIR